MITETLTWHCVADQLPDDDVEVLLATSNTVWPIWPGYHSGDYWFWDNGNRVENKVTHWSHMPAGPQELKETK